MLKKKEQDTDQNFGSEGEPGKGKENEWDCHQHSETMKKEEIIENIVVDIVWRCCQRKETKYSEVHQTSLLLIFGTLGHNSTDQKTIFHINWQQYCNFEQWMNINTWSTKFGSRSSMLDS